MSVLEERPLQKDDEPDLLAVKIIEIQKHDGTFGFNIKGPVADGGSLIKLNGKMYPPLNYISSLKFGGPASAAGLKIHDAILEVNDIDVRGMRMSSVSSIINNTSSDSLKLSIMYPDDIKGLKAAIEKSDRNNPDLIEDNTYTDRYLTDSDINLLPISIPMISFINCNGKKTAHFNIFGRRDLLIARRFSDFYNYYRLLKSQLLNLPPFPNRWPLIPNNNQLEVRRKELESFMASISKNPILLRMAPTRELLGLSDINFSVVDPVNSLANKSKPRDPNVTSIHNTDYLLNISLAGHSTYLNVIVNESDRVSDVFRKFCAFFKISQQDSKYFALYHQNEEKNEILMKNEKVYEVFIEDILRHKHSLISVRKNYIGKFETEAHLFRNTTLANIIFHQIFQDVSVGLVKLPNNQQKVTTDNLSSSEKIQLLNQYRGLENYGHLSFRFKQAQIPSKLISALPKEVRIESVSDEANEHHEKMSKITGPSIYLIVGKSELRISHMNIYKETPMLKMPLTQITSYSCDSPDNDNRLLTLSIEGSLRNQIKIVSTNTDFFAACLKSLSTGNDAKLIQY